MSIRTGIAITIAVICLYFLYFFGLDRVGMLGPDEPRYAAIGRAMAATGDWISPRLWGQPWFEKPPLLYWMTAIGFKAGLGPELAPRLPVALLSVGFLVWFGFVLQKEFGRRAAFYAAVILGTSAGWLAYSHVAVTDLPLAAFFGAAMLLFLRQDKAGAMWYGSVLLGLAVLAKGLVPVVLFLPALWFYRRRAAVVLGVGVLAALPWYVLATARYGRPFLEELIWKQHFARFFTPALEHVQPVWYFVPVLLAGLFPWTPLTLLLFRKRLYMDARVRFLLAWLLFGFVLFSASRNKLPGYVLPLLPAAAALMGIALDQAKRVGWALAAAGALVWLTPAIADALPSALLSGATHVEYHIPAYCWLGALLTIGFVLSISRWNRVLAATTVAAGVTVAAVYVILTTMPVLDETVSARRFWRNNHPLACSDSLNRTFRYGLNYYEQREVPDCTGP